MLWRYIHKILSILAFIYSSFSLFLLIIFRSIFRLKLYNTPFTVLIYVPDIFVSPNFLEYTPTEHFQLPVSLVNSFLNDFIVSNLPLSLLIFTDSSISSSSVSFSFFISKLNLSSYVNIAANKFEDKLVFASKQFLHTSPLKIPFADLPFNHGTLLCNAWQSKWASWPPSYAAWHRSILQMIHCHPQFCGLSLSRNLIIIHS